MRGRRREEENRAEWEGGEQGVRVEGVREGEFPFFLSFPPLPLSFLTFSGASSADDAFLLRTLRASWQR